jgi:RecA-family ATPase
MVHAPAGVGKSWFAYGLGVAVAGGGGFLDWKDQGAHRVLYVDGEMSQWDMQTRLRLLMATRTPEQQELAGRNFTLVGRDRLGAKADRFPTLNVSEDVHRKSLDALIAEVRPELVILDNLSCLTAMEDENDASAWQWHCVNPHDFARVLA